MMHPKNFDFDVEMGETSQLCQNEVWFGIEDECGKSKPIILGL